MIRDMELLLNTVYDDEIKSYLREALNCYSAEAYRACVIMSIIGGIHDLHNKLKILAPIMTLPILKKKYPIQKKN